jgi:hypothetical protein
MKNGPKSEVEAAVKVATIGQAPPAAKPGCGLKASTLKDVDRLVCTKK